MFISSPFNGDLAQSKSTHHQSDVRHQLCAVRKKQRYPVSDLQPATDYLDREPITVAQAVERRFDLRLEFGQHRDRPLLGLVNVFRHDIELGAVAGRETHGLAELGGEKRRLFMVERHTFSQLDRSVMVRRADKDEADHVK